MTDSMLFSPLTVRGVTFRNRIAVSPMCQYSSEDGFANEWHKVHLGSRAAGGAGLVIMEATAVTPEGRITPGDHGLWKREHVPMLRDITGFIKAQGAVAGIQIGHAGRKASCARPWEGGKNLSPEQGGWTTLAPSPLPFLPEDTMPQVMSLTQINELKMAFINTATLALEAGFEVLELHAAHGYLLHEFLSPLANRREDQYGGTFENRIRLVVEIAEAVRAVWPQHLPLFARISASDWVEGGWTIADSVKLAQVLGEKGVDLIDCSSGGMTPDAKIAVKPGYQVPFAEQVKREAAIMTGAVGMITDAKQAETILQEGKADLVLLARAFLKDPYWPLHAARELGVTIPAPVQYRAVFVR